MSDISSSVRIKGTVHIEDTATVQQVKAPGQQIKDTINSLDGAPPPPKSYASQVNRPDLPTPTVTNFNIDQYTFDFSKISANLGVQQNQETADTSNPIFNETTTSAIWNSRYTKGFEEALKNLNLSEEEVNQLRFYFYHPEMEPPVETSKQLTVLKQQSMQNLQQLQALPENWTPEVDSSEVDVPIELDFDKGFAEAASTFVGSNGKPLSASDQKILQYMHANPDDTSFPEYQRLIGIKESIDSQVIANLQKQYGFGADYTPKASWQYNGRLTGNLNYELNAAVDEFASAQGLTDEQIAQLKQALANPEAVLPDAIKALVKQFKPSYDKVIENLRATQGLPSTWVPENDTISSITPKEDPIYSQFSGINDQLKSLEGYVTKLPASSEKVKFLNFLQAIISAVNKLQQTLYEMQTADSNKATEVSNANLSVQKEQVKIQDQQRKEAEEAAAKQKDLQLAMKILGPIIMAIALIIAALTGGAAAFIVAVVATVFTVIMQQTDATSNIFTKLDAAIQSDPNIPAETKQAAKILAKIAICVMMVAVSIAGGAGISSLTSVAAGVQAALAGIEMAITFLTGSGAIQDIFKAMGVPDNVAQILAVVIGLILSLVTLVVGLKVMDAIKDIPETAGRVTEALNKLKDKLMKNFGAFFGKIQKGVQKFEDAIPDVVMALKISEGILKAGSSAVSAYSAFEQAALATKLADFEAFLAETQAIITILKKLIKNLLDNMGSVGEDITSLNNQMSKFWQDYSQSLPSVNSSV